MTQKVDFSLIKMKLLSLERTVKDSVECAPNGYYFLPLFAKEKREFIIKVEGPAGWSFGSKWQLLKRFFELNF